MNAYQEFCKARRPEIKKEHPEYSHKTVQRILSDEWKKYKGAGASIKNRKTTIQYEVNKTLINLTPKFDISESDEICKIVNSDTCSYCDKPVKKSATGDHFLAVVSNAKTPILTNFSHITIPCCSECNSSKANKKWQDFANLKEIAEEKRNNLIVLDDFINQHIKYYTVDQKQYDELSDYIVECLEEIRRRTEILTINEVVDAPEASTSSS